MASLFPRESVTGMPTDGEWYAEKPFSLTFILSNHYHFISCCYFIVLASVGAAIFRLLAPSWDATHCIFMSLSCVSQSGLSVTDWPAQHTAIHIVGFMLMICGSGSLLTAVPIIFRLNSFRRQARELRKGYKDKRRDLEKPTKPTLDRKRTYWDVNKEHFEEDYGPEFIALQKILRILLCYWCFTQLAGFVLIYVFGIIYGNESLTLWNTFFLTCSAFQNNGLTLTENSTVNNKDEPLVLCVLIALISLGNTALPIFMRVLAVICRKTRCYSEKDEEAYKFLLEYPRRCYTHMFPAAHTLWLLILSLGLTAFLTLSIWTQDGDSKAFEGMTPMNTFMNSLYATVNTRTSGFNSLSMDDFSYSVTFLMIVWMYIAASPTIVLMHHSSHNHYDQDLRHVAEQRINEGEEPAPFFSDGYSVFDIEGRHEHVVEVAREAEEQHSVKFQARQHLLKHGVYIILIVYAILVVEKYKLDSLKYSHVPGEPKDDTYRYSDFSFMKVIFEVMSAYGTVGLSLGFRDKPYSFSGALSDKGKLCVCLAMFLGRIRGLPNSIDSSVRLYVHGDQYVAYSLRTGANKKEESPTGGLFRTDMNEAGSFDNAGSPIGNAAPSLYSPDLKQGALKKPGLFHEYMQGRAQSAHQGLPFDTQGTREGLQPSISHLRSAHTGLPSLSPKSNDHRSNRSDVRSVRTFFSKRSSQGVFPPWPWSKR